MRLERREGSDMLHALFLPHDPDRNVPKNVEKELYVRDFTNPQNALSYVDYVAKQSHSTSVV